MKKFILLSTLILSLSGCGMLVMWPMMFDSSAATSGRFEYCPIVHKKVFVLDSNMVTSCEKLKEHYQLCQTTFTDRDQHTWSTKPFVEEYYSH